MINRIKIILGLITCILIMIIFIVINSREGNVVMESSKNIKITINNKSYDLELVDNETVNSLLTMLPLSIQMQDLNNNEKYIYLNSSLPKDEYKPKRIEKGDVMLFNDNCLVIFYKSFNTEYRYTKIGHINNLDDLNNDAVDVIIEK